MSHPRKKQGQRKDHKVQRMREDEEAKRAEFEAKPPHPTTDQHDVQSYKPGGPTDRNRHQPPPSSGS